VYICYLDASKAFDRINHWTLFKKLIDRNVPAIAVRLLCSWYTTQLFSVQWGTSLSECFYVSNGVRQGGILSPILFNVYIDDLSSGLTKLKIGCNFNGIFVNHLIYADDTVLLAPSPSALQKLINHCVKFAECNDIFYNLKKTKCMCVRPKGLNNLYFPKMFVYDNEVKVVSKEKYLGVFITDDCNDDEDMTRQMRSIYARGNALIRNFKHCSEEVKSLLFKTYCTGFYCSPLWSNYKGKTYTKIKVAYNNIFRMFMGLHGQISISKTMIDANIDPFKVVMRKYIVGLSKRLDCCNNVIVNTLYNWLGFQNSNLFNVWCRSAYGVNNTI